MNWQSAYTMAEHPLQADAMRSSRTVVVLHEEASHTLDGPCNT
jgi:hypothetical protein